MKRRNFFKGLMGLATVAVLPKVEIKETPKYEPGFEPPYYGYDTIEPTMSTGYVVSTSSVEMAAPMPMPKQFYRLYEESEREMALTLSKIPTHLNK
jgi:hypothetical protein